jgi:hypothetical protein
VGKTGIGPFTIGRQGKQSREHRLEIEAVVDADNCRRWNRQDPETKQAVADWQSLLDRGDAWEMNGEGRSEGQTSIRARELETNMKIDIDKLSEAELIDLNHRVVERLRFLSQMRAHSKMLDFQIGERVTFHPEGHPALFGIVTRYNRKTVTVITDTGQHWNVAPGLLRRADSRERTDTNTAKVVRLKRD